MDVAMSVWNGNRMRHAASRPHAVPIAVVMSDSQRITPTILLRVAPSAPKRANSFFRSLKVMENTNSNTDVYKRQLLNKGYPANYQIIVSREKNSDKLEVQVEMTGEMFSDTISKVYDREKELIDALKAMLGIYAEVHLVAPKTIARSEGKAVRVIDKRNLY